MAPFQSNRITSPHLIELPKIIKIACGGDHCLAISEEGIAYGWGSNSHLQLSH